MEPANFPVQKLVTSVGSYYFGVNALESAFNDLGVGRERIGHWITGASYYNEGRNKWAINGPIVSTQDGFPVHAKIYVVDASDEGSDTVVITSQNNSSSGLIEVAVVLKDAVAAELLLTQIEQVEQMEKSTTLNEIRAATRGASDNDFLIGTARTRGAPAALCDGMQRYADTHGGRLTSGQVTALRKWTDQKRGRRF